MAVSFRPETLRGAGARPTAGMVDFRLARNSVVSEFRKARLSRLDVCDAHPELLRVATHLGRPAPEPCPICESPALVHVTYVFGPRIPASGRAVSSQAEMVKLDRGNRELTAYVVEVCAECSWNHLVRSLPLGRRRRRET